MDSKLEQLRADFAQIRGQPFTHFYCPILFRDDDTPLCQAHIINRFFPDSSRNWTVQRSDIDSFYGSQFEADFAAILYHESGSPGRVITDRTLSDRFRPRLTVDDKPIEYYFAKGSVPERFTPAQFSCAGRSVQLGLKTPPEDFSAPAKRELRIEINKDVRIAALVSLIKSAHLTLYERIGYRHALSAGGYFVGRQILGEFAHMVRSIQSLDYDLQGTIADGKLLWCIGSEGSPWVLVVFIRTSRAFHAVLIPVLASLTQLPHSWTCCVMKTIVSR